MTGTTICLFDPLAFPGKDLIKTCNVLPFSCTHLASLFPDQKAIIDLWRNLEGGKKLRKSHHLEDVLAIPVTAEKITNLGKGPVIYYVGKGDLEFF